jgi:hypothetical protein
MHLGRHDSQRNDIQYNEYKKSVVVQNKSNLLLKIILNNTWTLQIFTINKTN